MLVEVEQYCLTLLMLPLLFGKTPPLRLIPSAPFLALSPLRVVGRHTSCVNVVLCSVVRMSACPRSRVPFRVFFFSVYVIPVANIVSGPV